MVNSIWDFMPRALKDLLRELSMWVISTIHQGQILYQKYFPSVNFPSINFGGNIHSMGNILFIKNSELSGMVVIQFYFVT